MLLICVWTCIGVGGNHNLDLNLGISPPSPGNGSKENEGCLQFHSGTYDAHSQRTSKVKFKLIFNFPFSCMHEKPKFDDVLEDLKLGSNTKSCSLVVVNIVGPF